MALPLVVITVSGFGLWVGIIGGIITLIGVFGGMFLKGYEWFRGINEKVEPLAQIPEVVEAMREMINNIDSSVSHELNHNSGTSVKDKTYRAVDLATEALSVAKQTRDDVNRLASQLTQFMVDQGSEQQEQWTQIRRFGSK